VLDGRKSAIGILGSLVSALFIPSQGAPGTPGEVLSPLAQLLPTVLAGPLSEASPVLLPVFLALAAWGALGKVDKYARAVNVKPGGTTDKNGG
jgi:hypothetical protein